MTLYTFFLCQADGSSHSFEAHELRDDQTAASFAQVVLRQHGSAAYVMVYAGERFVWGPAGDGGQPATCGPQAD